MAIKSAKEEHIAQDGLGVEVHTLTDIVNKQDTQMLEVVQLRDMSEDPHAN
jgi:hypothetical protein